MMDEIKKPNNNTGRLLIFLFLTVILWFVLYYQLMKIALWISFTLLPLKQDTSLGKAVVYFLFNIPKVFMLLSLIIFIVGIIRSFFSPEKTRQYLQGKNEWLGNILAALLGIVTPFCTCSAVPLFIGFVEAGIPLGVTFSFLISAPMINEVALVMLFFFGWKVVVLYLITGLSIAIFAGLIIGKLQLEKYVEEWVYQLKPAIDEQTEQKFSFKDRVLYAWHEVGAIIQKVWPYIFAGLAVGAMISGYVSPNSLAKLMGKQAWWSVPLAVLIGIPMYSNAAGLIPVVQVLMEKGASLGTVLAFMMAVIGLSLPEMIILRKVLKLKLILIFVGVVGGGILIVGYLFNILL
jgi:uncharacterized membrane protein YraQ (UPF0718 family)